MTDDRRRRLRAELHRLKAEFLHLEEAINGAMRATQDFDSSMEILRNAWIEGVAAENGREASSAMVAESVIRKARSTQP